MAKCVLTLEDLEDGKVNISLEFENALQAQEEITASQDIAMQMLSFAADLIKTNKE
jgi:hypothetical protein